MSDTPTCPKCHRPFNLGNSPNSEECNETDDDEGLCEAYSKLAAVTRERDSLIADLKLATDERDKALTSRDQAMAHQQRTMDERDQWREMAERLARQLHERIGRVYSVPEDIETLAAYEKLKGGGA